MPNVAAGVVNEKYASIRGRIDAGERVVEVLRPIADDAGIKVGTLRAAFAKAEVDRGDRAKPTTKEATQKSKTIDPPANAKAAIEMLAKLREAQADKFYVFMRDAEFSEYVAKLISEIGPKQTAAMLGQIGIAVSESKLRKLIKSGESSDDKTVVENVSRGEDAAVGDGPAKDPNPTSAISNDGGVGRQVTRGPLGGGS